jgi:two-component sensor histidine kinase
VTEEQRLAALRRYHILDSPPDSAFDQMTAFAAGLLHAPIAFIALVDADRIWFKSRFGFALQQVERTQGLCASCILREEPLMVADARIDPSLSGNPLIQREGIRFYCGVPLRTPDRFNIGTLAVLDRAPRTLSDAAIRQLAALSRILMDGIELRHAARLAQTSYAAELARRELREDHIRGLLRELAHRAKNLLAVVQALAWQTTTSSGSVGEYAQNLAERIQGLAQTHDLIAEEGWRGIAIDELVRCQLTPLGVASRAVLVGPHMVLSPTAAQNVGLALNELATNALKYGALSTESGRVAIGWQVAEGAHLCFTWQEENGPSIATPSRRGFGVMVLERITPEALAGESELSFEPRGLSYRLIVPLSKVRHEGG